jgi:hypothetical protein
MGRYGEQCVFIPFSADMKKSEDAHLSGRA